MGESDKYRLSRIPHFGGPRFMYGFLLVNLRFYTKISFFNIKITFFFIPKFLKYTEILEMLFLDRDLYAYFHIIELSRFGPFKLYFRWSQAFQNHRNFGLE